MVPLTTGGIAIIDQSKQGSDALQYGPVFPNREANESKLMVTITSTRQRVWWPISSLLKAQAIKSIPASFRTPDYNTNCRIKHCRLLRLKSQALMPISFFFFCFLKQLLFSKRGKTKTNIIIQWSGHQEIIVFIVSGLLSIHVTLQTVYLPLQRAVVGHKPGWSPQLHVVHHLCAIPRYGHYSEGSMKEMRLGGDWEVNAAAILHCAWGKEDRRRNKVCKKDKSSRVFGRKQHLEL